MKQIRNFSIIAHIDHGKSTLADRLLEVTGTIEKRKMRDQVLDSMDLERERGITIKMQPVRMIYHPHRGMNADLTRNDAENSLNTKNDELLYEDLTYKVRGILFNVRKNLGLGHKEQIYHNALEAEFTKAGISFQSKKNISIQYDGKNIGTYQPDFILDDKILLELKALPEIGKPQLEQLWAYLKGCEYRLALLVNFGSKDLEIKRVVYDTARGGSSEPSFSALSASSPRESAGVSMEVEDGPYILHLIDTPGHIDFSYEVSRALTAVEGAVLLVDSTQGVQAQTFTTLRMAQDLGLTIIPAVSKIDSPLARVSEVKTELAMLLGVEEDTVIECSGRTGAGAIDLLEAIIKRVPAPQTLLPEQNEFRGLIFDFQYSDHRGVIVYTRVFDGEIKKGTELSLGVRNENFTAIEVGTFSPGMTPVESLSPGEIGYIVTGIKEPGVASVGDTVKTRFGKAPVLPGFSLPKPVVWASFYPESQDDFVSLRQALTKLRLSDSSLSFEEETSGTLGRGFRCGFLGMLHLEIISERLRREFNLELVVTTPTITYHVELKNGEKKIIYSPALFPDHGDIVKVWEPLVSVEIVTPPEHLGSVMQVLFEHEAQVSATDTFSEGRILVKAIMPLRELMRGFFDRIKTVSSGYASISYEVGELREADVTRLDILVADEPVSAFTRIVASHRAYEEAEAAVEKLYTVLPRQMFTTKIQGFALGRILASRTLSALRKDVTQHMYGGDITRKMKLREKQKKGKKKMMERGRVNIPHEVFLKMVKNSE